MSMLAVDVPQGHFRASATQGTTIAKPYTPQAGDYVIAPVVEEPLYKGPLYGFALTSKGPALARRFAASGSTLVLLSLEGVARPVVEGSETASFVPCHFPLNLDPRFPSEPLLPQCVQLQHLWDLAQRTTQGNSDLLQVTNSILPHLEGGTKDPEFLLRFRGLRGLTQLQTNYVALFAFRRLLLWIQYLRGRPRTTLLYNEHDQWQHLEQRQPSDWALWAMLRDDMWTFFGLETPAI